MTRRPRPFTTVVSDDPPEVWLRKVLGLDRETPVHSKPDFFRRAAAKRRPRRLPWKLPPR